MVEITLASNLSFSLWLTQTLNKLIIFTPKWLLEVGHVDLYLECIAKGADLDTELTLLDCKLKWKNIS